MTARYPLVIDANGRIAELPSGDSLAGAAGVDSAALDSAFSSTQGAILYRNATAWVGLAPGTSGQVLQTNGAGANPSWATPSGGSVGSGGLVLLNTLTASSSASLSDTTSITSAYDVYEVVFVDLVPATNSVDLAMRLSTNGGSSYDSSGIYDITGTQAADNNFTGALGNTAGTYFPIINSASNNSDNAVAGTLRLFNPGGSRNKRAIWDSTTFKSDGHFYRNELSGQYKNTTAVDAFTVLFSSGNIASGTVRVYGVAK